MTLKKTNMIFLILSQKRETNNIHQTSKEISPVRKAIFISVMRFKIINKRKLWRRNTHIKYSLTRLNIKIRLYSNSDSSWMLIRKCLTAFLAKREYLNRLNQIMMNMEILHKLRLMNGHINSKLIKILHRTRRGCWEIELLLRNLDLNRENKSIRLRRLKRNMKTYLR